MLKKSHTICELHFDEKDVIREVIIPMPDGSEYRQIKPRPTLKRGAIPCIFPEVPSKILKINSLQNIIESSRKINI